MTWQDVILRKHVFMAKFGDVVFSSEGLSFQDIKRTSSARIKTFEVLSSNPISQFRGMDAEKLVISGTVFTDFHVSGKEKLDGLYKILREGKPQLLSLTSKNSAFSTGLWHIEKIDEHQTIFKSNGEPLKIAFTLELIRSE